MGNDAIAPPRVFDWTATREAFVQGRPTPTLTELSARFGMSVSAISRCAKDEGWAAIRAEYLEQKMREAGASEIILGALQNEGGLIKECREFATDYVRVAKVLLEEVENDKDAKASTRANTFNTIGFGVANISRFIDVVGLVGMPRDLRNKKHAGENADGQPWEKGMLQQINVTVQNIERAAKSAQAAEPAQAESVKPAGAS